MQDNNVGVLLSCLHQKQERFNDQADQLVILKDDLEAHRRAIELSILAYMQVRDLYRMVIQDDALPKGEVWICQRRTTNGAGDVLTRYQAPYAYAEEIVEIPF